MTELSTPGAVRKAVRAKIKEILVNRTDAGRAVYVSRSLPSDAEALPAIGIYTTGENAELFEVSPKLYQRDLSLLIEVNLVGDDDEDLDNQREAFGDVIEGLIEADETLGGLVDSIRLTGNEFAESSEGESPVGKLSILFTVRYYLEAVQKIDLDSLNEVQVNWKMSRPEGLPQEPDAQDVVNFES